MTKLNSLARARVIGPGGGAEDTCQQSYTMHNTGSLLSTTRNSLNDYSMSNHVLSCCHADYFRLPLNGLTPVANALIRAKPPLSYHASTHPVAMAKQAPQRPGA
jgi:hypothetical protein